ncbi:TPA: conjugal transfer protein [Enterococcus faecalis]|nr:conjugal transfer protein [Enterococcus faecalis]HBI1613469.1 conjugal transfer protein [Enterococcus faecalis]
MKLQRKKAQSKNQEEVNKKKKKRKITRVSRVSRGIVYSGWGILLFSIGFGVYNNVTAVSTHTVHEREVVKEQLKDTTGLQSYAKNFAKLYFTVSPTSNDQQKRREALDSYLAENVAVSTALYKEVKEKVTVDSVEVWKVKPVKNEKNIYSVLLKVGLTMGKKSVTRAYSVDIYVKDNLFAVVKLPTLATLPSKAVIEETPVEQGNSIDATTREAVEGFLDTFFSVYPKADEKELIYYGKNLTPVESNLTFLEITNSQISEDKNGIYVRCIVTYRDNDTKLLLEMPYKLTLEKVSNEKFAIKEIR